MTIDLRLGAWEDALTDFGGEPIACDALITDPPFGERTHDQEEGTRYDGFGVDGMVPGYNFWTPKDVYAFVMAWSPVVRGWMVTMTSHDLVPAWEASYAEADRYCFAPIPCVINGMSVRRSADGPSSWTVWLMVARPRTKEAASWGTLPGAYVGARKPGAGGGRGKPQWLMRSIVRDYSRVMNTIVDPMAGWGSTLIAASGLGRRAIGAERDRDAYNEAVRRISGGVQSELSLDA